MWSWPALLLSPMIALGNLTVTYALVTPACQYQQPVWIHAVTLLSFVVSLAFTVLALMDWRQYAMPADDFHVKDDTEDGPHSRKRFIAIVSTWCGALFTLTILAQSIAQWMLSPCLQ